MDTGRVKHQPQGHAATCYLANRHGGAIRSYTSQQLALNHLFTVDGVEPLADVLALVGGHGIHPHLAAQHIINTSKCHGLRPNPSDNACWFERTMIHQFVHMGALISMDRTLPPTQLGWCQAYGSHPASHPYPKTHHVNSLG